MEEWKLKDICDLIVDCPHSTAKDEGHGYPLIRTPNVGKGRLLLQNVHRVNELVYKARNERAIPSVWDIILAREAPVGNAAIIMPGQKVCLGQRVVLIRANNCIVNPMFLVYYLLSDNIQHKLKNNANGAVVAHLNMEEIRNLKVSLPDIKIQNRVASILSSIDDKIDCNRRINDNLEQQAQALFKSWFVDFDPFKDGEFVESEMGLIPKGWRVGLLSEIGEIVGGSTPSKAKSQYYTSNGIPWLTPKDLSNSPCKFTAKGEIDITKEGYASCSTKIMPKGTVLFSSRAPIGYVSIAKNEICTNQGFKSVVPKEAGTAFIYYFLKTSTKDIENKATGSTFKEASGALMKSLPTIIPTKSVLYGFEQIMEPIFRKQETIEDESRRLAQLRDTLLPRLMSGELKVNEI